MPIGSILDVINAKQVELLLGADSFVTLQEISMPLRRNETREEVEKGSVYFYSQHDNSFDAVIFLTALNVSLYLDNNLLVNGALVVKTYDIRLTSKANNVAIIQVKAVTPSQNIEKLPDGGVRIYQSFRITEDVNSGNLQ